MQFLRKKQIIDRARDFKGMFLSEIAKKHKIWIYQIDLTNLDEENEIIGILMKRRWEDNFSIYVEETLIPTRKRFTIAHELWHYFLHTQDTNKKIFTDYKTEMLFRGQTLRSEEHKEWEKEANLFAAELLMPEEKVKNIYSKETRDVKELANKFGVSEQAMAFRLANIIND